MREIKFRAWNKIDKTMGLPFTLRDAIGSRTVHGVHTTDVVYMQFTGLRDKDGREIYEGDIVSVTESLVETFVWVGAAAGFKTKRIDRAGCSNLSDLLPNWPHYEVIGNIYEEGGPHA